jgi:hypothetical protein
MAARKVDKEMAIKLRDQHGLTYNQIGAIQGCTDSAVHKAIKGLQLSPLLPTYKEHKADILASKQADILAHVDSDVITAMSGLQALTGFAILFDKERVERGQATQITDVRGVHVLLTSQIDELRKMLCNQSSEEDCTHNDYRDAQVVDIVDDNGQ